MHARCVHSVWLVHLTWKCLPRSDGELWVAGEARVKKYGLDPQGHGTLALPFHIRAGQQVRIQLVDTKSAFGLCGTMTGQAALVQDWFHQLLKEGHVRLRNRVDEPSRRPALWFSSQACMVFRFCCDNRRQSMRPMTTVR